MLGLRLIMVLRKAKGQHPWWEINPKAQPDFAAHQRGSFRRSGNASRGTQRPHWALALLPWCSQTVVLMDRHTKEGRGEEGRGKKMRLEKHWGYPFKVRLFLTLFIKSKA